MQQCRQLKKQLNALDNSNDTLHLHGTRARQAIMCLRLERAMLVAHLSKTDEPSEEEQNEAADTGAEQPAQDANAGKSQVNSSQTQEQVVTTCWTMTGMIC